ncbi:IclR family transcriptional regulator [uncultured Sneathiella sp.]|uniref:IclR family transcriptional regulator n=1 Tax=uncultured Sneathiella sp. TaxID=879315 RepID=UPI0030EE8C68|tara:strand:+ start:19397 stop:20263 length:867 start_codon:yes stop_codon:yes gene_type:complete
MKKEKKMNAAPPSGRLRTRLTRGGEMNSLTDRQIVKPSSGKAVGAVAKSIKILRYIRDAKEPAGVTRIAKDTNLNASTCFNILKTLAAEDFVVFDPQSRTYAISFGVLDIALGATALGRDITTIQPLMDRIARDNGVTLTLWQPVEQNRKALILSALARNDIRIQMAIGQRLPILLGATGRCFAAFSKLSDEQLQRRFKEMRWKRPLNYSEFYDQVQKTAVEGWSLDEGYFATGTISIAVPVLDNDDIAIMAATATMFADQHKKEKIDIIVQDLNNLSRRIKQILIGT